MVDINQSAAVQESFGGRNVITLEDIQSEKPIGNASLAQAGSGPEKQPVGEVLFQNDEDDRFVAELKNKDSTYVTAQEKESLKEKKRENRKETLGFYDQAALDYEPINKNLYIESSEISNMTPKQVNDFRKSYGDIKVRGLNCPRPISSWFQCGLPDSSSSS